MTRRAAKAALYELQAVLDRIPIGFQDDGCSHAPDRLFGADLVAACRAHDYGYCSRAWPAGRLDQDHRSWFDAALGRWVRALIKIHGRWFHRKIPFGGDWAGWLYWRLTHDHGGDAAFDSCGASAGPFCRHSLPRPMWML